MRKFKIIIKNIYAFPFCGTDGDPLIRHATRATFPAGEGWFLISLTYSEHRELIIGKVTIVNVTLILLFE